MKFSRVWHGVVLAILAGVWTATEAQNRKVMVPKVEGDFWQIAGDPDVGRYTSVNQQPVDFSIWQAADGTWQLWSCIRSTKLGGHTRLFHRWQAATLTDTNWTPMGIAMMADTGFGESEGGLQAPYVFREGADYVMLYGDWTHIAMARSRDGKTFARQLSAEGKSGMFGEEAAANTRDPMMLKTKGGYYVYYSAHVGGHGAVWVRTSTDMVHWSEGTKVAYGGAAGDGPYSAECPWVYFDKTSGFYFLLRNQKYGKDASFTVYRSKDPMDFGKNDDKYLVETMPYAAPEIVEWAGQLYLATLLPSLKGIQVAKLAFAAKE